MRAAIILVGLALTGGTHVTVTNEPKPEEKKFDPSKKECFNQTASVRKWAGGMLLNAENVPAYLEKREKKAVVHTIPNNDATQTPPRSEITVNGETWVVKSSTKTTLNFTIWINIVEKKEDKKDEKSPQ